MDFRSSAITWNFILNLVMCLYVQDSEKYGLDQAFEDAVAKVHLRIEDALGMVSGVKASLEASGSRAVKDTSLDEEDDSFHEQLTVAGQYAEHLVVLLRATTKKGYNGGPAMEAMHSEGACHLKDARITIYVEKESLSLSQSTVPGLDWDRGLWDS